MNQIELMFFSVLNVNYYDTSSELSVQFHFRQKKYFFSFLSKYGSFWRSLIMMNNKHLLLQLSDTFFCINAFFGIIIVIRDISYKRGFLKASDNVRYVWQCKICLSDICICSSLSLSVSFIWLDEWLLKIVLMN